jgi:hypothetical protein
VRSVLDPLSLELLGQAGVKSVGTSRGVFVASVADDGSRRRGGGEDRLGDPAFTGFAVFFNVAEYQHVTCRGSALSSVLIVRVARPNC